jgi:protein-S-isoprenylcysteine O-methyltransferase Ste14
MPITTLLLFGLALIAALVMAIGWATDPVAPTPGEWFVAKITEGGLWTGLFLSLIAVCYFGWRRNRAGRQPKDPN